MHAMPGQETRERANMQLLLNHAPCLASPCFALLMHIALPRLVWRCLALPGLGCYVACLAWSAHAHCLTYLALLMRIALPCLACSCTLPCLALFDSQVVPSVVYGDKAAADSFGFLIFHHHGGSML